MGIYFKIVACKFKKDGIKTIFKVKDVQVEECYTNNSSSNEMYITTFEFTYNDQVLQETIQTDKKFELNKEFEGLYLPSGKLTKISVAGEGYKMPKGGDWLVIFIGLLIINLVALVVSGLNVIVISIVLSASILLVAIVAIVSLFYNRSLK